MDCSALFPSRPDVASRATPATGVADEPSRPRVHHAAGLDCAAKTRRAVLSPPLWADAVGGARAANRTAGIRPRRRDATCAGLKRYPCDGDVERGDTCPRHFTFPERRLRANFPRSIWGPGFANLTREQRLARLEAIAKLLDVAFILPGTKIRYGIDGIIGLIPVVGDIIATALSLWLVREARALGAPWHVTARMLANVAIQGVVGTVPVAGDAFDVLFRANMRNARLLRRWIDRQPR